MYSGLERVKVEVVIMEVGQKPWLRLSGTTRNKPGTREVDENGQFYRGIVSV